MNDAVLPLRALTSRYSVKNVCAPGPSDEELGRILQAAMSAPDHGMLRPWRFVLIHGEAIAKLADVVVEASKSAGMMSPEKEKGVRAWLADVPLLLGLAHPIRHGHKIPEDEQLLSMGAAVMNVLNAAHLLGYGAFWSTGLGSYLPQVQTALGLDPLDYRFMGFLTIGTPAADTPPPSRPDYRDYVTVWTGS